VPSFRLIPARGSAFFDLFVEDAANVLTAPGQLEAIFAR